MVFHGSGSDYFDEAERGAYFADVTEVNRDMALCEYLVESEQFVCPLAEMQVCSAASTVCAEGIRNEQEFPHDGCLIRAVLEQSNLSLDRLNMNKKLEHITEAYINKSEGDATKALQLALIAERGKEELEITGHEVLVFLGVKIALPILCSFAKDALYNKYKQIKTKKDAESAKAELLAHTEPLMAKVKKETVVTELTRVLTPEGIPEEKAKRIVEHCYNEVESDLGLENKSAASGKP